MAFYYYGGDPPGFESFYAYGDEYQPIANSGADGAGQRKRPYYGPDRSISEPAPKRSTDPQKPAAVATPAPRAPTAPAVEAAPYNPALPGALGKMLQDLQRQQADVQRLADQARAQELAAAQEARQRDDDHAVMVAVEMMLG